MHFWDNSRIGTNSELGLIGELIQLELVHLVLGATWAGAGIFFGEWFLVLFNMYVTYITLCLDKFML
jgi:hypothetical protein